MTLTGARGVEQAVVVAHDPVLRLELMDSLNALGIQVVADAGCGEQVFLTLASCADTVFVSATMPDKAAFLVVRTASSLCPPPFIVIVSTLPHPDLFDLAHAGARAYLPWPATPEMIRNCVRPVGETKPDLVNIATQLVGRIDLRGAQTLLRRAMLSRALTLSDGSLSAAARILGVTRPALQRIIREKQEC